MDAATADQTQVTHLLELVAKTEREPLLALPQARAALALLNEISDLELRVAVLATSKCPPLTLDNLSGTKSVTYSGPTRRSIET